MSETVFWVLGILVFAVGIVAAAFISVVTGFPGVIAGLIWGAVWGQVVSRIYDNKFGW